MGRLLSSAFGRAPDAPGLAGPDGGVRPDVECRAAMRAVLEAQIIPRLLQVQRPGATGATPNGGAAPSAADVEAFARVCATGDRAATSALVERLRAGGLQPESVLVDLVTPAARHLGRQWEDDSLDFASVTVGLVVMHELIHELGYEIHDGPQQSGALRRVMLASAPGSQHVLGLAIVSEFFRKAGWQVVLEVSPSRSELCHAVRNEWFDLVGLSVALDSQLADLPTLVGDLRAASLNPVQPVLLGGPVFLSRDLQPAHFGAQAICVSARDSVQAALTLVGR
ncbi:MAG: cobalamin-dependent protein [Rubrivivax sp.]|nr:cobalamin-dependent protein [Rubrivivax sp.]